MKFYNRESELQQLDEMRQTAFTAHSQLTAVTGRRRIGKTKLILKSCEQTPTVYLFVARTSEKALCTRFAETVRTSLGTFIPEGVNDFADLFEALMNIGHSKAYNLVIDEFQEFYTINPAVFSRMQDIWDRYKDTTHVNLIVSGSVQTLMHRIFMDYGEPLYGRLDKLIVLKPFTTTTLKEIMTDCAPGYTNDDLLALYTITGGVPKYVELLIDRKKLTREEMIDEVCGENSIFLEEGNILLVQEFGKKFGNYYAILSAIACGRNTITEITTAVGTGSVGGLLQRLENDYHLIAKWRPIMAKEGSQTVRYEIADLFLRFWFRYIVRHQDYLQSGLNTALADLVKADYPVYSGLTLERYFRQKLLETKRYRQVGSWWETRKGRDVNQNEIDIVAIEANGKRVLIAEVKRQRKNFKPQLFQEKVDYLRTKLFHKEQIVTECLTLEDM